MAIPRNFDYKNYDELRNKAEVLKKKNRILIAIAVAIVFLFSFMVYSLFNNNQHLAINQDIDEKKNQNTEKKDEEALRKKALQDEQYRKKLQRDKRLKTASNILEKAAEAKKKGEEYLQKGLGDEANSFFNESLDNFMQLKEYSKKDLKSLNLTREELFYNLATLFFNLDKLEKAKEIILNVVDTVRDKRYLISAGCIFIKSNEYDRALSYFQKAGKADPEDGKINYYQGLIYSEKKDYKNAIKHFAEAIKKGQKDANLYSNMGLLYNLTANYEESEKCYLKALERDSGNWQYYDILGILNFQMGKPEKSRDYYLKALELSKNIPEIYYNLGTLEFECENYKLAKEYLGKLMNKFPNFYLSKDVRVKIKEIEELLKKNEGKKSSTDD